MDKNFIRLLNSHSKPVSRRDFLSLGLMGFAGFSFMPKASASYFYSSPKLPAFLVFDLAGGAALPGNFLVGGAGGSEDYLKSYDSLGWNPRVDKIDNRFGLPMASSSISKMLEGILVNSTISTQSNFKLGSFCHQALSDSYTNSINALGLVASFMNQKESLQQLKTTSDMRNQLVGGPIHFMPQNMASPSEIIEETIKGPVGVGMVTIGGCDYHDGTSGRGDSKDLEIGKLIGESIELAALENRELFIQIVTDGGVYARQGSREWMGDCDDRCLSLVGYFNPRSAPEYKEKGQFQIGHFLDTQKSNRDTLIGDNPELAGYSAFANYLQVCGKLDEFEKYAGGVFTNKELEEVLIFS